MCVGGGYTSVFFCGVDVGTAVVRNIDINSRSDASRGVQQCEDNPLIETRLRYGQQTSAVRPFRSESGIMEFRFGLFNVLRSNASEFERKRKCIPLYPAPQIFYTHIQYL